MGLDVKLHGSNLEPPMSALGQKQTLRHLQPMSALPPKADMVEHGCDVRFVPKADIGLPNRPFGGNRRATKCPPWDRHFRVSLA